MSDYTEPHCFIDSEVFRAMADEADSLMSLLRECRRALSGERVGAAVDDPEGARYIRISDTRATFLVRRISKRIPE